MRNLMSFVNQTGKQIVCSFIKKRKLNFGLGRCMAWIIWDLQKFSWEITHDVFVWKWISKYQKIIGSAGININTKIFVIFK